jgi:periplasmic protein TonB
MSWFRFFLLGLVTLLQNEAEAKLVHEQLPSHDKVFLVVEQQAEYPGGITAMLSYLAKQIKHRDDRTERLLITFVVGRNGYMRDVHVSCPGCQNRSISYPNFVAAVVRKMPRWKPARHKGRAVSVRYNYPFALEFE